MQSLVHTGPSLIVKITYDGNDTKEKTIGYANSLDFRVSQGQKDIYVVDSPFPQELAQGAAPSSVKGTMTMFLPKGQTLESLGLVPYRTRNNSFDEAAQAYSRYFHLRVYDRLTSEMVLSCDFTKVSDYSITITARQIVRAQISFTGTYLTPGNAR